MVSLQWIKWCAENNPNESEATVQSQQFLLSPLTGMVVYISGYDSEEIDQKIMSNGATISTMFSRDTTHFLCNRPEEYTIDCDRAKSRHIPMIDMDFIDECLYRYSSPSNKHHVGSYTVVSRTSNIPLSENVANHDNYYMSQHSIYLGHGFDKPVKQFVKRIVRDAGGNFMNSLDSFVTHFIICGSEVSSMYHSPV